MSINKLKALLNDYCQAPNALENDEKERKQLGSKANLLEEIIYEARNLKAAEVRGPVWRDNVRHIEPGPVINVAPGHMPRINGHRRLNNVRRIEPGPIINVAPGRMPYIGQNPRRLAHPQQPGGTRKSRKSRKSRQSLRKTRSSRN